METLRRLMQAVFSTAPSSLPMVSAPASRGTVASAALVVLVAQVGGGACASSSEEANSGPPAFAGASPPALASGGAASAGSTPPELTPGAAPPVVDGAGEGTGAPASAASNGSAASAPAGNDSEASDPEANDPEANDPEADSSEPGPIAPPLAPPAGSGSDGSNGTGVNGGGGAPATTPPVEPPAPGAGGTGEVPLAPSSSLPAPPNNGVPRPAGAAQNLRVLDWAGFTAAVSYTFDDSNSSQFQNYPALAALDVPMTFYLQTEKDDGGQNDTIWRQILSDGHELGNHTRTHQQGGPNIAADTDSATRFIESRFGTTVFSMAAPFGDTAYVAVAQSRFLFNRGVNGGLVRPNDESNPFNLPCFIPATGANVAAFNTQVDMARNARAWQIVLVHGFTGGSDGAFQPVGIGPFTASIQYAKSFGDVWIDTLLEVGAYWRAQKLISSAAPTTAGGTSTWRWTLPDHFPADRFVRVRVDGGTLTQDGIPLVWDEHGYYEVALDVGTLTLSP